MKKLTAIGMGVVGAALLADGIRRVVRKNKEDGFSELPSRNDDLDEDPGVTVEEVDGVTVTHF